MQKNHHNQIRLSQRNPCKIKVFLGCPYYTAIPVQHIPKLWELIQRSFSDKFSDSGLLSAVWENFISNDTGVEVDLKHASVTHLVLGHQFRFSCFRIHVHASEFVHLKGFSVFTDPGLRKEDRAG